MKTLLALLLLVPSLSWGNLSMRLECTKLSNNLSYTIDIDEGILTILEWGSKFIVYSYSGSYILAQEDGKFDHVKIDRYNGDTWVTNMETFETLMKLKCLKKKKLL